MERTNVMPAVNILVIEDNEADIELLQLALDTAGFGYELKAIHDGAEALKLFKQEGVTVDEMPGVVVLDLNLPKYDGLEILQAARANRAFTKLPIVVLSSSSSPRELSKIEAFDFVRFMYKPSELDGYLGIGKQIEEFLIERGVLQLSAAPGNV